MPMGATGNRVRADAEIFQHAVEASPCGLIIVADNGRIVLVNREIERLFGYRRNELIGRPIGLLLPNVVRGKRIRLHCGSARYSKIRRLGKGRDFMGRSKKGKEIPVDVALNPAVVDGEQMVIVAIVDMSARKRRERMQDEIVATVSHEIRTPLTSMAAALGLLRAGASDALPQPAAHLLDIAHDNCRRLVRLVDDILDLKKLGLGKMAFRFQRCEALLLLEKAVAGIHGFAVDREVGIALAAPPTPIEIYVDPDRFIQVMTNLLSNALKFSRPGDEVAVKLERRGGVVRVAVRDRGPGIPDEFKPLVFEAFARGDSTAGRNKDGSGLGLSISRELVSRMHGRIGFADARGGGTIFYIDLPDAGAAARRASG